MGEFWDEDGDKARAMRRFVGGGARDVKLGYFKVGAIASNLLAFLGGTLCIDNDVALRRRRRCAVALLMRCVRTRAVGLNQAYLHDPRQHRLGVPHKFCERNSGVIFWAEPVVEVVM